MVTFLFITSALLISAFDSNQNEHLDLFENDRQNSFMKLFNQQNQLNIKKTRKIQILTPFINTLKREDGTYECKHGFISDGPIDSRGCWICNKTCKKNSICAFPGLCFVPTPLIIKASKKGKNALFVSFSLNGKNSFFSPVEAFCKVGNGDPYPAISVSSETVKCEIVSSSENPQTRNYLINKIQISFDGNAWSNPFEIGKKYDKDDMAIENKRSGRYNDDYSFSFILFFKILVFLILLSVTILVFYLIFCGNKQKKMTKEQMFQEETIPIAFFPEIREK